jgi:hypothetical protein
MNMHRKHYHWDTELAEMEKNMDRVAAALTIAGYDGESTFECGACGETLPIDCMVAVVRGDVPQLVCLNCADEDSLPAI